jgi:hypothetical protein
MHSLKLVSLESRLANTPAVLTNHIQPSGKPATIEWLKVGGRTSAYVVELQRLPGTGNNPSTEVHCLHRIVMLLALMSVLLTLGRRIQQRLRNFGDFGAVGALGNVGAVGFV